LTFVLSLIDMSEVIESKYEGTLSQEGQLDPSGFIRITGEATGQIELGANQTPIEVIGTPAIRDSFGASCMVQAIAAACSPGVSRFILNPDAHWGYGVPIGSVLVSPTHIYPSPVGVDIKCSMSLLQTDVPEDAIADPTVRRQLIREIEGRLATKRRAARGLPVNEESGFDAAVYSSTSGFQPIGWIAARMLNIRPPMVTTIDCLIDSTS
jgi:hypothetical protein